MTGMGVGGSHCNGEERGDWGIGGPSEGSGVVDAMVVAWIPACAGMTEGGRRNDGGGRRNDGGGWRYSRRRVPLQRGGGAAIEGSEGRRKVRGWLMRWWSHGFLPAQE